MFSESLKWINENIKYESFEEIKSGINQENAQTINLIDSFLRVKENFEEVFEIVEKSGKSVKFIYSCIEYLMKIRPNKIQNLFSLFCLILKKKGLKDFEPTFKTLTKLLIHESFIPNEGELLENETVSDIIGIYKEGSIERAIKEDNIDLFLEKKH